MFIHKRLQNWKGLIPAQAQLFWELAHFLCNVVAVFYCENSGSFPSFYALFNEFHPSDNVLNRSVFLNQNIQSHHFNTHLHMLGTKLGLDFLIFTWVRPVRGVLKKRELVHLDVLQGQKGIRSKGSMTSLASSSLALPGVMHIAFVLPLISCSHCVIPSLFFCSLL